MAGAGGGTGALAHAGGLAHSLRCRGLAVLTEGSSPAPPPPPRPPPPRSAQPSRVPRHVLWFYYIWPEPQTNPGWRRRQGRDGTADGPPVVSRLRSCRDVQNQLPLLEPRGSRGLSPLVSLAFVYYKQVTVRVHPPRGRSPVGTCHPGSMCVSGCSSGAAARSGCCGSGGCPGAQHTFRGAGHGGSAFPRANEEEGHSANPEPKKRSCTTGVSPQAPGPGRGGRGRASWQGEGPGLQVPSAVKTRLRGRGIELPGLGARLRLCARGRSQARPHPGPRKRESSQGCRLDALPGVGSPGSPGSLADRHVL